MKNLFCVLLLFVFLFTSGLSAQTIKVGHIDFEQLLQVMPEREAAQKEMNKVSKELEDQMAVMQKELTDKGKEYMAQEKTLSDAVKATKQDELQSIQTRIETFRQQASETISKAQTKNYQPVLDKARKAVSDVAKEQGMLYVFEVNQLLYHSDQSIDILPLVKSKLGVK